MATVWVLCNLLATACAVVRGWLEVVAAAVILWQAAGWRPEDWRTLACAVAAVLALRAPAAVREVFRG